VYQALGGPYALGAGAVMARTRSGNGSISSKQWPAHFSGCIYVESLDMAFCSDGRFLPRRVFRVRYGGYKFAMDASGVEHSTDPWEAWTQHRIYAPTIVTDVCHDPALAHGVVVSRLLNVNPSGWRADGFGLEVCSSKSKSPGAQSEA
jgi:hypothetical protein